MAGPVAEHDTAGVPRDLEDMTAARLSRVGHKWLALVVGLQFVLWTASGVYMVVVDLDFIHGDSLVRNLATTIELGHSIVPVDSLRSARTDINAISLRGLPDDGSPVYEVVTAHGSYLVDARTGRTISPLARGRVIELARAYYAGRAAVRGVTLIATEAERPSELQGRPMPLWRVDFGDWLDTSLYLHPDTGRLVTRRHRFWRWFDFLWSLHIMDYETRSDVNNWLLRVATILGVTTAATGLWLTYFSFGFLQRRPGRRVRR